MNTPLSNRGEAQASYPQIPEVAIPQPRKEPWRYTYPNAFIDYVLNEDFMRPNPPVSTSSGVRINGFEHQSCAQLVSDYVGKLAPSKQNYLAELNRHHFTNGFVIHVDGAGNDHNYVKIRSGYSCCERFLVIVEPNTHLELLEHCAGGNRVIECVLKAGATLIHRRLQEYDSGIEFNHTVVRLSHDSVYSFVQASRGTNLRRNEVDVLLTGEGAQASLTGAWTLDTDTHMDTQINVNHLAANSSSQTTFHGIVHDNARAVFNGKIYIARAAHGVDAHLQNKNLATSDQAETYTKPELELYADDISCSHGATSGHLDEEQLFYLRSRGIPESRAVTALLDGFLKEVIDDEDSMELLGLKS